MNGVHDLGGLTCFGPVEREHDEPVFHAEWERRVFALNVALARALGPIDQRRHAIERMDPVRYLDSSYYEHWLVRVEMMARELGLLTAEELSTGKAAASSRPGQPLTAEAVEALVRQGKPASRDTGRLMPRFSAGERVRARNIHPAGHTRLPRYVRGHAGLIERIHGTHVFPDTNAHGEGENPQPLYSVGFEAIELWGPSAPGQDYLYVDLWEDYLEPEEP